MTKYYWKGKLIRSSKTRDDYKFALMVISNEDSNEFGCITCSSTFKGAAKNFSYIQKHNYHVITGKAHLSVVRIDKGE